MLHSTGWLSLDSWPQYWCLRRVDFLSWVACRHWTHSSCHWSISWASLWTVPNWPTSSECPHQWVQGHHLKILYCQWCCHSAPVWFHCWSGQGPRGCWGCGWAQTHLSASWSPSWRCHGRAAHCFRPSAPAPGRTCSQWVRTSPHYLRNSCWIHTFLWPDLQMRWHYTWLAVELLCLLWI